MNKDFIKEPTFCDSYKMYKRIVIDDAPRSTWSYKDLVFACYCRDGYDSYYKTMRNLHIESIRGLISGAIRRKGWKKNSRTYHILGCDYEYFFRYIESKFEDGMTWDNHGEWHLDHIYPVSLAKDEQHLIELNHYTNFQPLWAKENIRKKNKVYDKNTK